MPADPAGQKLAGLQIGGAGVVGHVNYHEQVVNKDQGQGSPVRVRRARSPLAETQCAAYVADQAGTALLVRGAIPVALINSEGAGSVGVLASLPGAHLCMQVLGNSIPRRSSVVPPLFPLMPVVQSHSD